MRKRFNIISVFLCFFCLFIFYSRAAEKQSDIQTWEEGIINKYQSNSQPLYNDLGRSPSKKAPSKKEGKIRIEEDKREKSRKNYVNEAELGESKEDAFRKDLSVQSGGYVEEYRGNYAIYQSQYTANIEEDVAFIKGDVTLETFDEGRQYLPLVATTVGLKKVSLNNKECFITRRGNIYYAIIDDKGRYKLSIEFFIKVNREREGGPGFINFALISSPISVVKVEINQPNLNIFVEPSMKTESKEDKDKTVTIAVLPYTENVKVSWNKALVKESLPEIKVEPKIYAETSTLVSLGEGVAKCYTVVDFSILQSEVGNFEIYLPEDVNIVDVKADKLRNWKVTRKDSGQVLEVYLNFGVQGKYTVGIEYERSIGAGSVTAEVPAIKVLGVEREKGFIGVEAKTNVEIKLGELKEAALIDSKELPQLIWSQAANPILLAFKYLKYPYNVVLDVVKHKEVPVLTAVVDKSQYSTLITKDGKILTRAVFFTRNNVRQFLKVTVPENAEVWSCLIDEKPVKPARDEKGNILIPLKKSQDDAQALVNFAVEVVYLSKDRAFGKLGKLNLLLPKLDLPQNELNWDLYLPQKILYFFPKGDVEEVKSSGGMLDVVSGQDKRYKKGIYELNKRFDQYLNTQQSVTNLPESQVHQQEFTKMAPVLPIKINFPMAGKILHFKKVLVTEENPYLYLNYVQGELKLVMIISIIIGIGLIVSGVILKVFGLGKGGR